MNGLTKISKYVHMLRLRNPGCMPQTIIQMLVILEERVYDPGDR